MSPIDLPRLLLILAKAEYSVLKRSKSGCVDAVLLVKAVDGIRVDIFEDWEDENVNDNTSREAIEAAERLLQIHAEQLVCHAALHLGYGEPPAPESSQFTILLALVSFGGESPAAWPMASREQLIGFSRWRFLRN